MPVTPTYPGIYIEEVPSTARTITAAPTSITVFVGYTHPFKTARTSDRDSPDLQLPDYEREFGGLYSVGSSSRTSRWQSTSSSSTAAPSRTSSASSRSTATAPGRSSRLAP